MSNLKIALLVGSLRRDSFNMKMAKELMSITPELMSAQILNIGDLPLYNEDLEASVPPQWQRFRDELNGSDGVLFITPEYNRSVPGVLKNAIDVGSRPYGRSAWDGKPGAVVSVSPGAIGGFGANHHLRQSLVFMNVPAMQQPEAYIGNASELFDNSGRLTNNSTKDFMKQFMAAFLEWVKLHSSATVTV